MSINKLAIFDFDDTLFKVPEPNEETLTLWKEKTGKKWPHNGWWDQDDSLNYEVFDIEPKYKVLHYLNEAFKEANTYTILLSGRPIEALNGVKLLLQHHNIKRFDRYLLNDNSNQLDLNFKINQLDSLAAEFPDCYEMDFWDDRIVYVSTYQSWGVKNFGTGFSYYFVK